jgi:ElaB/YqjD/DUF883 family membrane-anchored ribosome-binding protein
MSLIDYLIENSDDTGKAAKAARLREKLKRAKADLKDMSVTPHSQEAADAIDDARQDVKRLEAELKGLEEGVGYTAAEAYERHTQEINTKLQRIADGVKAHAQRQVQRPNEWGHAGDLAHVNELLDDVLGFLLGE